MYRYIIDNIRQFCKNILSTFGRMYWPTMTWDNYEVYLVLPKKEENNE